MNNKIILMEGNIYRNLRVEIGSSWVAAPRDQNTHATQCYCRNKSGVVLSLSEEGAQLLR